MGASTSKTASKVSKAASLSANNSARKYPTRSPPASNSRGNVEARRSNPAAQPSSIGNAEARTSPAKDKPPPIDDSPNLALNSRLRTIGPVDPFPTFSNSSTANRSAQDPSAPNSNFIPSASAPSQSIFPTSGRGPTSNPAVSLLTARYRIAEEAEREFEQIGRKGFAGRSYLDVNTLRTVLVCRSEGMPDGEIERRLGLRSGVVKSLGGEVVSVGGL